MPITWKWAVGDATGAGVTVAVVDSGVDASHPRVGTVEGGAVITYDPSLPSSVRIDEQPHQDLFGHGTACAGIARQLAPGCDILSVRVLGKRLTGKTTCIIAGVRWALAHGARVINLSLSTPLVDRAPFWHQVADECYFKQALLVCAANNLPGPTFPAQFASVISVACHPGSDPRALAYNPDPPVEFGARGLDVEVAWAKGTVITASGNSFAAAHVSGLVALILERHPDCTPFDVKTILRGLAAEEQTAPELTPSRHRR
ncbi:MAG: S8 family serine peptidase [Candidatus Dormiibacterota bacterium]